MGASARGHASRRVRRLQHRKSPFLAGGRHPGQSESRRKLSRVRALRCRRGWFCGTAARVRARRVRALFGLWNPMSRFRLASVRHLSRAAARGAQLQRQGLLSMLFGPTHGPERRESQQQPAPVRPGWGLTRPLSHGCETPERLEPTTAIELLLQQGRSVHVSSKCGFASLAPGAIRRPRPTNARDVVAISTPI